MGGGGVATGRREAEEREGRGKSHGGKGEGKDTRRKRGGAITTTNHVLHVWEIKITLVTLATWRRVRG